MELGATYNVIKDPNTGEEGWIKNPTSKHISYSPEDLKKWVNEGMIPPELEKFALNELEKIDQHLKEVQDLSLEEQLALMKSQALDFDELKKKSALLEYMLENKEKLLTFLKEAPKKKRGKVRHSGHFADQKLEYKYPEDKQPSLFEIISPVTKDKIEEDNLEIKTIGIRLTSAEDKLINAIYKLLHDKSETRDINSESFYNGNVPGQLVPYGGQEAPSAYLKIKPTELYKEYLGEEDYSGKDIDNIKNVLHGLSKKQFLIIYDRKRKIKIQNGKKTETRTDRIEVFQSLIRIVNYIEDLTDAEVKNLDRGKGSDIREQKGELVIALHPLLTDQISSKYVEYPADINRRTMIAAGGHRHITESINALRDYMIRELSNKRLKPEINADRLPYILKLEKYVESHRKKLIKERIEGAIETVKRLGLIQDVEMQVGAQGQAKYVFTLNPEFLRGIDQ